VSARDGKRRLWVYALGTEPGIGSLPLEPVIPTAPSHSVRELVTIKPQQKIAENEDGK